MHKRGVYLILVVLVVAGVLVVVSRSREREPVYGGKRLSEWVEVLGLQNHDGGYEAAEDAVRHLGTKAVPGLLKWLRYETPVWKVQLYRINPILRRASGSWGINENRDALRIDGAARALKLLGPNTPEAIVGLGRLANDPKGGESATRATVVLGSFGNAGLPGLLVGLTNQNRDLRTMIGYRIGWMGTDALPAVPALLNLLKHSDSEIRNVATNVLREIAPEALEKSISRPEKKDANAK